MTSDVMLESDKRQSVSEEYVADVIKANESRAIDDQLTVPVAGISCARDKKHGRMLMNKSGMLECGPCGYQVAPTKD